MGRRKERGWRDREEGYKKARDMGRRRKRG